MRRLARAVLLQPVLLLSLLLAYLALAASWAGASTSQLLVRQPGVQGMPLSPRQRDILLRGRCRPAGWFDTTYAHCAG
jgi:hypothetical protein